MAGLFGVDWASVLLPSTPIMEIFVRGTLTYLALFALLRLLKRESGTLNVADLLVVVLLSDAIQNGMSGDYHSISDGLLLVITILFWSYALDWLGYHFAAFRRLIQPPPLLLVKDGEMLRRHMRQELITKSELMEHLREEGVDDLKRVKRAFLESNGQISVITYDEKQHPDVEEQSVQF
jgi:uncharacterized membrane protein YcaP (DUF421 family)